MALLLGSASTEHMPAYKFSFSGSEQERAAVLEELLQEMS